MYTSSIIQSYRHWYWASMQTWGTEEVFQLVLEFLESDIDKEYFDKILELLIKNQKVKTSCSSIPKEEQVNNIHITDKNNLKEDLNNFKNLTINKSESMKYSFFKEVSSFKSQLLETSEIDPT